ncbi:MAG: hypothetical protein LBU73_08275 [Helicobacteraceae bacterium]|jgi:5-formyltetrahydrofolate cyclo-ligase|nr:hypothetical protein [Helicobacteraceae bacterium]
MTKKVAREIALKTLKSAPIAARRAQSAKAASFLKNLLKTIEFKSAAIYVAMPHEVNLRRIFPYLRRRAKLFAPRVSDKINGSMKMVKFRLPLERADFGIYAPRNSPDFTCDRAAEKLDLIIAPAISASRNLTRVGFGGGFYDRFWARYYGKSLSGLGSKKPIVILTQPIPLIADFAGDLRDIKGDYLVSSKGIIRNFRDKNGRSDNKFGNGGGVRFRGVVRNEKN